MSVRVIGKCSLCGGRVVVPSAWWSINPPVPTCEKCGAVADTPGPVIPMKPRPRRLGGWQMFKAKGSGTDGRVFK